MITWTVVALLMEDAVVGGVVGVEIVHLSDGCGPVVPAG
jgi:hypothetical protein